VQAHNLIGEIEDEQLSLQYKACYARICDSKRKFLEAATHYYDLSQSGVGVQCALLALLPS
jgi:COP9 signalosome complex subunit 4